MRDKLCAILALIGFFILFLAINWLENETITEEMCLLLSLPGVAAMGATAVVAYIGGDKEKEE